MQLFSKLCGSIVGLALCVPAAAEDWPQWLGPHGSSDWTEDGIRTSFDDDALSPKWTANCGLGYAGPVVSDGRVYVFDYEVTEGSVENNPGRPVSLKGRERLHAIDAASGQVLWTQGDDVEYYVSYPSGPRATPCVDGQHIYTLGTEGDLTCRRTSDGEAVWHVNFLKKFGTKTPIWGHSSCPLVVGELVVTMVGGDGTAVVAFDKATGEEAWRALSSNEPGYSAPMAIELEGKQCVVAFHPGGVSVLDAKTGAEVWAKPIKPKFGMSISVPRLHGSQMFVTSYGEAMLVVGVGSGEPSIEWKANSSNEAVYCSNSTPYFADDAIYGCDIESSQLMAIEPSTGERLWQNEEVVVRAEAGRRPRHGTAFIVRHTPSGRYFLFNELGQLLVADLSRDGIEVHGRSQIIEPSGEAFGRDVVWTHPAFANQSVYARNDNKLVCIDLAE